MGGVAPIARAEALAAKFAAAPLPRATKQGLDEIAMRPMTTAGTAESVDRFVAYVKLADTSLAKVESGLDREWFLSASSMRRAMRTMGNDASVAAQVLRHAAADDLVPLDARRNAILGAKQISDPDGLLDRLATHAASRGKLSEVEGAIVRTRAMAHETINSIRASIPTPSTPEVQSVTVQMRQSDEEQLQQIEQELATRAVGLDVLKRTSAYPDLIPDA